MSGCEDPPVDKMRDILVDKFDFVFAHEEHGNVIVFPVRKKCPWTEQFKQEVREKMRELRCVGCFSYFAKVLRIYRKPGMCHRPEAYGKVKVEWVRDDIPRSGVGE